MNINVICIFSAIYLTTFVHFCSSCEGIKNVLMEVETNEGERSNVTLTGCIERSNFNGKNMKEIHVRHQKIPKLRKDYVKHLIKLDTIEFNDCQIDSIAIGAFRNLPRIRVVEITNNLLTEIVGGIFDIFDTIKILRLNNNQISSITDEALSNMTMTEVDFSHNKFTEWKNVWFFYSFYIEKLDFSFNYIRTIPNNAFDYLSSLKEINFEHNQISYIGNEAFSVLSSIDVLNLKSNQLSNINPDIFPNKLRIKTLNVASNTLDNIHDDVLAELVVKEIILDHNPWLCPCLKNLYNWININKVILKPADNCKLDYLPICINSAKCEPGRSSQTQGITKYHHVINGLHISDRECIGL